jgi:putative membrane protein
MKIISAALFGALASVLTLTSLPGWAQSAGPTDPQIAAIVVTANQVDIDAGTSAGGAGQERWVIRHFA